MDATAGVRINTTTQLWDETVTVGGVDIPIKFTGNEKRVGNVNFVEFSGKFALRLGDFVEIEAEAALSPDSGSADGRVFVGIGPSRLDDGSPNPNARGVLFENAHFAYLKANNAYAVRLSGTATLVGFPGITLSADLSVEFNGTGAHQTLPDGTSIDAQPDKQVTGSNIDVAVGGFTLHGGFTFTIDGTTGAVTGVSLTGVELHIGDGLVDVTGLHGDFKFDPAGVYGRIAGTVTFANVPGFDCDAAGRGPGQHHRRPAQPGERPEPARRRSPPTRSGSRRSASTSRSPARRCTATSPSSRSTAR